jgi:hypothetical protein
MEPDDLTAPAPAASNYKLVGLALGGLFAVAVLLAAVKASRTQRGPSYIAGQGDPFGPDLEPWQASLEHLARTFDTKFNLMAERLDRLTGDSLKEQATQYATPNQPPATPVYVAPAVPPAAVSLADPTLVPEPAESVAQHPQVGALEPPPPGPAAVSLAP